MGMAQSESGYSCSLLCLLVLLSQANSLRPSRTSRGCSDASTLCSAHRLCAPHGPSHCLSSLAKRWAGSGLAPRSGPSARGTP